MASVVLRSVGSAVGNALLPGIGGAFLGNLGRSIGGSIDGSLGLGASVTGPRLENLSVQDSRYGAGIPIIYGSSRVAGNVIWSTNLMETQHNSNSSGGKGGALGGSSVSTTTYTYSVHCAVGIAAGPIGSISTIWADSTIIYQNGLWTSGILDSASIYLGSSTQNPDAFMQSLLGSGNVPAYRGLAYIVFENLQLANFGNRLPNLTFEVTPTPNATNPIWLGGTDAQIYQRTQTADSGGQLPIVLASSGSSVETILLGGYANPGSTCVFEVAAYDVTDNTPAQVARYSSATFSATSPEDSSWALAPDGRFVAMYLQNSTAPTHNFVIYDSEAQQFGNIYSVNLSNASSATKQIAWIDAQHFLIDDCSGTHRGLHVFARAGLNIIDLGFVDIWGASTLVNYNNFYYSQFISYAGGLLNIVWDVSIPATLTLYVRPMVWQNNQLVVSAAYTLVSGIALASSSGFHGTIFPTGGDEWTLFFGSSLYYACFSFVPGLTSATITRPWQSFTPSFGISFTNFPIYYGDRLVIVQRGAYDSEYRLSEVLLNSGSYTLSIDGANVSGGTALADDFCAMALDNSRLLLLGDGPTSEIGQLGIIERCPPGDSLSAILTDILTRAGYAAGDYNVAALGNITVDGYVLQEPMTARAAIEPLQLFTPFDIVESGTQLVAVLRHATADVTVPSSEWRAAPDKQDPPPPLEVTRTQELDLPAEIDVDYIDENRDFEVNSQRARRIVTKAQAVQKVALPIVCTADTAKQIAETRLYTLWAERELVRLRLSRKYLALDPGDVIDLSNGNLLRVAKVNQAGGLMEVEGFYVNPAVLNSTAAADLGPSVNPSNVAAPNSSLYLMDLPLLQSTDDQPGVYAAASGLTGWTGASLWRASDGVNYSPIASLPVNASAGIAVTVPLNLPCDYMDNSSSVDVQMTYGTLSSCSLTDLYNGANAALLGSEILQFQTATLMGPGLYTLTGLLRGRRATEYAAGSHVVGENFVMLTSPAVEFVPCLLAARGSAYEFRALSKGQALGAAQDTDFTYNLTTIQPFAPANIQGSRASGVGSDLTLVWKRRARLNAEWVDYIDVPLDEPTELYNVNIMNGTSVVRSFLNVTSPTVTYTAAEQTADWGTVPATFTVNICQISARYGPGQVAVGVL